MSAGIPLGGCGPVFTTLPRAHLIAYSAVQQYMTISTDSLQQPLEMTLKTPGDALQSLCRTTTIAVNLPYTFYIRQSIVN